MLVVGKRGGFRSFPARKDDGREKLETKCQKQVQSSISEWCVFVFCVWVSEAARLQVALLSTLVGILCNYSNPTSFHSLLGGGRHAGCYGGALLKPDKSQNDY
jgi:hypothetical protein